MKEKLLSALGSTGLILWYIISSIFTIIPFVVLGFPFIVNFLLIAVVLLLPGIGDIVQFILWVWSFVIVLGEPFGILSIIYYVTAAVYVFTTLLPLILILAQQIKNSTLFSPKEKARNASQNHEIKEYLIVDKETGEVVGERENSVRFLEAKIPPAVQRPQ